MKYSVRPIKYAHVEEGVIYGVFPPSWSEPLIVVAPSAALLRKGLHELGIYAGRAYKTNTSLGQYEGKLLGRYGSAKDAGNSEEAVREDARGNTMLCVCKRKNGEYHLIDGSQAPPPYFSLCNDPRGTRLQQNLRTTEFGTFVTTQNVPAFDTTKSLYDNVNSELLWDYGKQFWRHGRK